MAHAVRWGGLLAWAAVVAIAWNSPPSGKVEARHRAIAEKTSLGPSRLVLDEPPEVPSPTPGEIGRLASVARRIAPAVLYVGHPEGDSGTAFVISREHRLLATNAHVAEILEEAGGLVAVGNGSHAAYAVDRAWYHPDYARARDEGVSVRSGRRRVLYRGALRPDLAVLRLADGGPELEAECVLTRGVESIDLARLPVGMLGFSGPRPDPGRPMEAVFKTGVVSLLTDFAPARDPTPRWKMVDFTAPAREGDSGGPVFLADGRVVAVNAWSRIATDRDGARAAECSAAIRVDTLWELLDHHGLRGMVGGG